MIRLVRLTLAVCALLALAVGTARAAAPTTMVIDLNDPAIDADESAFASDVCDFPIVADVSGHIRLVTFDGGGSVQNLNLYNVLATYTNPETGATYRLRDIGPDRFYVKRGVLYVAVTGRSETGSGVIGVVKINLDTGEVVHSAGKGIGFFYDRLCAAVA
jgi:hypothetical protein